MKKWIKAWILRNRCEWLAWKLALKERMGRVSFCRADGLNALEAAKLKNLFSSRVLCGPFEGMAYAQEGICSEKWPKLIGSYEAELSGVVEQLLTKPFKRLIDVGSAEGYYAVGFAVRRPAMEVIAVDPLQEARRRLHELAKSNAVLGRIQFRRFITDRGLNRLADRFTLVIMDCEGSEFGLLKLSGAKGLAKAEILVEVHDFVVAGMAQVIARRFEATHSCTVIAQQRRNPNDWKCLDGLEEALQLKLLDGRRPRRLCWMHLVPYSQQVSFRGDSA